MNIEIYNKQLNPCQTCKTRTAEIFRTEKSVGVMCNCGNQFVFEDTDKPLKEVVEWWNKHYGLGDELTRARGAKSRNSITLKNVNILSCVKWHFISSLVGGFFIGVIYSLFGYLTTKENLAGWLFWYVPGSMVVYSILGVFTGFIVAFIYNMLADSLGGLKFEIESEELEQNPPAPPSFNR